MTFHGLFIGVDRYSSPLITNLTCCKRDATVLYGLFADAFGESSLSLLTDDGATRAAVLQRLDALASVDADDVVFVHFSGHGSDIHHLITHDADPALLDATAVLLDELVQKFQAIPARNAILCLDCCFSGGAGAKVFASPTATRSGVSPEALLQKIGGAGRVIFTASGADEQALEDRKTGHGLFSHYLIQAFTGAPEIVESGQIPLLSLAHFVTSAVEAAALALRHTQKPALRGTLDGSVNLPQLTRGAVFARLFPNSATQPVTSDLGSLASHGFSAETIAAIGQTIPALNELQQDAINGSALFEGEHVLVTAPTSSGKTMIGELAALKASGRGERCYMLLPLRALVNDKYQDLTRKYGPLGIRVIRSTGEISDDDDAMFRGKFDIALLTYERFAALAVTASFLLRNAGVVIIDEVQMIADEGRGASLEFLLTYLRSQRAIGIEPQLIALSAVIGNTNGFERWLGARLLASTKRPVPLEEGTIDRNGTFHYIDTNGTEQVARGYVTPEYRKGSSQDVIIPLVRQLVLAGEKVIVFRDIKSIVRSTAAYLAENIGLPPARGVLNDLPSNDPSAASATLRRCLQGGVAFHNADLDREEREVVEASFRDPNGEIKVLAATTTLAMGVNTPAWSVIIEGLVHPGDVPYSVAEYKNMAGRAGRLGWTPKGKAFLVAFDDERSKWQTYVRGNPEGLQSRFLDLNPNVAICRVLGTATAAKLPGLTTTEVADFLQSTFASFQTGRQWPESEIKAAVSRLVRAGLVVESGDRLRLTPLGEVAGTLGVEVESVIRVAAALRGVDVDTLHLGVLIAAAQVTVELEDVYMPLHRKSIKERARWQGVLQQQRLPSSVVRAIADADDTKVTARAKKFAAALMWAQGIELDEIERSVLRHMPDDNAAGPIRGVADRTRDLIGVVARIAEILSSANPDSVQRLSAVVDSGAAQLELGIPQEAVWLAADVRRLLARGDYLALCRSGLISPAAIGASVDDQLVRVIPNEAKRRAIVSAAEKALTLAKAAEQTFAMPKPPTDP